MDEKQTAILNGLARDGLITTWTVEPELDTQDIRESYIPCRCEQAGQYLLWLWAALDEVDRLRAKDNSVQSSDVPGR